MPEMQVFLSSPTLCGLPWTVAFPLVKDLGFDGLEILLTRRVIASQHRFYALEREYGLALTFHRWWRGKELSALILGGLRIFPADGIRISHVLQRDFSWPVVVSTYTWEERFDLPTDRIMMQPACTGYDDPKSIIPFEDMRQSLQTEVPALQENKLWIIAESLSHLHTPVTGIQDAMDRASQRKVRLRIVFDVMHWLEYKYHPNAMPHAPRELLESAMDDFTFLREQISEIHIYDFFPSTAGGVIGCNPFPGDGIFPIEDFLLGVRDTGWRGRIVWEIHPLVVAKNLWRPWWLKKQLQRLPALTREIFASLL